MGPQVWPSGHQLPHAQHRHPTPPHPPTSKICSLIRRIISQAVQLPDPTIPDRGATREVSSSPPINSKRSGNGRRADCPPIVPATCLTTLRLSTPRCVGALTLSAKKHTTKYSTLHRLQGTRHTTEDPLQALSQHQVGEEVHPGDPPPITPDLTYPTVKNPSTRSRSAWKLHPKLGCHQSILQEQPSKSRSNPSH